MREKGLLVAVLFNFSFILMSCGITEYYYLEPPLENTPATGLTSGDSLTNRFNFFIPNIDTGGILQGYVIYYKFYNSESAVNSDISSVDSSNAQYSSKGMERVRSLGYQQMNFSNPGLSDKLPVGSGYENIIIRLITEGLGETVGVYKDNSLEYASPVRDNSTSFSIYLNSDEYTVNFNENDEDVRDSYSSSFSDVWYINAYCAAYGQTSQLTSVYSEVLHLGTIRLEAP